MTLKGENTRTLRLGGAQPEQELGLRTAALLDRKASALVCGACTRLLVGKLHICKHEASSVKACHQRRASCLQSGLGSGSASEPTSSTCSSFLPPVENGLTYVLFVILEYIWGTLIFITYVHVEC